ASMFASLTTIFILLIINWVSAKIILSRFVFDESKEYAINTLKKYIIYFAIFITFLNGIGLDLSKITILVSALSVGMGFGLTTVVSNFISGILLLLEGTITVGDRLQLESEEIVTVINIGLRKSLLKTLDNIDVLMPNTELVSKRVTNLTYKKNFINRHRLTFKVSNHVDIQKLEKIAVASIIKTLGGNDKVYAKTPELQFTEINSEHYACVLLFYVDYLNNFIPDSKFYKNLLYDFIDNDIRFFEDPPLNEVLAEFSRDLRSGRIKLG
ncbi:MAG: mechanosensitive ion channel, partial [Deltaproteobacteria bacterium]|nr:mechanosensitive ion channel [Deltaproteobacteria bacterium]